MSVKQI